MAQVIITLPDTVSEQIEESGIDRQQLSALVGRFVELYLQQYQRDKQQNFDQPFTKGIRRPRKAGSGKHLKIVMAEDFDEPLEDFAEYM